MANSGEHPFEAAQLSASCLSIMSFAAEADRALEGRNCTTDQQALSASDRSAGLAAEVWLALLLVLSGIHFPHYCARQAPHLPQAFILYCLLHNHPSRHDHKVYDADFLSHEHMKIIKVSRSSILRS